MVITDEFREKVDKAARSVTGNTSAYDSEDIAQDIWVRLIEDPKYYAELVAMDDPFASLKRIAKQEVYKANNAWEFYSGNYTYTPGEVRGLLSEYLLDVSLEAVSEHVDLVEGLLMLKSDAPSYFKILIDKYAKGIDEANPAYASRSVEKLTQLMNQVNKAARYSYEGPGSRKVMTNSQAFAQREQE